MINFRKYIAFCFFLMFISSCQAVKSTKVKKTKTLLDDRITQLIIANYENNSFNRYDKCTIQYRSEIDIDTNQFLSILKTKIKIPQNTKPLDLPSGTQLFRYKLLSAYNQAQEQKKPRLAGQRLMVDHYTSLRIKPLINLRRKEPEEQSTPQSKEITGITVIPEDEYKKIKSRWIPQSPEPPTSLYT